MALIERQTMRRIWVGDMRRQPGTCACCGGSIALDADVFEDKDDSDQESNFGPWYCSEKCAQRGRSDSWKPREPWRYWWVDEKPVDFPA